ncbi:MAG: hypothetical protein MMC33_001855 [Icmadophila ericetorum]|nr:hypothetical protein [Icmadophila ericetorum]
MSTMKTGPQGSVGPTGPPGPTVTPLPPYSYLSCFYQSGSPLQPSGRVLSAYVSTYTPGSTSLPAGSLSSVSHQCAVTCLASNYGFFGLINNGTLAADCYCGSTLTLVQIAGVGSGAATDNNCVLCNGGIGECGVAGGVTVAIYSKTY